MYFQINSYLELIIGSEAEIHKFLRYLSKDQKVHIVGQPHRFVVVNRVSSGNRSKNCSLAHSLAYQFRLVVKRFAKLDFHQALD